MVNLLMKLRIALPLVLLTPAMAIAPATPRNCTGSVPVATIQVRVSPPSGGAPIPIRQVNTIAKGSKITCSTLRLPSDVKKNGRIALVVVPAPTDPNDGVTVLDPHTFDSPAEWTMPFQVGEVLIVFGPQGLDEKRVATLVSKDNDLISELAMYADQTEDLEDTIEALAAVEDTGEDEADSSPLRGTPADQVLYALTRALNPVMVAYNPLGAGKLAGPATMMGKASDAFFENAGGFVPGGGALPIIKSWLMPDTEFRTVYTEPAPPEGLALCAQRKTAGSRNRFVYLWAHRAINTGPPNISLARPAWLPIDARCTIPVRAKSANDWSLVSRVRDWTLTDGASASPVKVRSDERRTLAVDLRGIPLAPGVYRLQGKWDWGTAELLGELHLAPLADVSAIRIGDPASPPLTAGQGVVTLRLEGADFQFVERVSLRKVGALGGAAADLDYFLPVGLRAGPQSSLEAEIDTNRFRPGLYQLALAQTGGSSQSVPVRVAPPMPVIDNLPLRVNIGAKDLRIVLHGTGLDRIESLQADRAAFRLGAGSASEREVFLSLDSGARKGDRLSLQLSVAGVPNAVRLPDAIAVAGPRPHIAAIRLSPPDDLGAMLREGELPAGSFLGVSFQVENLEPPVSLRLDCANAAATLQPIRVRAGERRRAARLDAAGDSALFASFDPGAIGAPGCALQASVETESAGAGDPVPLGRVVRLPRIEALTLTNEKVDQGYIALLSGRDLETIEKTGWDASAGLPVLGPPRTLAAEGDRQTLRIVVTWPSPAPVAPLFFWLRGDKDGRPAPRK